MESTVGMREQRTGWEWGCRLPAPRYDGLASVADPTEKTRCGKPGEHVWSSDSQATGDHTGTPPLTSGANLRTRVFPVPAGMLTVPATGRLTAKPHMEVLCKLAACRQVSDGPCQASARLRLPSLRPAAGAVLASLGLRLGCAEGHAASRHLSEPCFVH